MTEDEKKDHREDMFFAAIFTFMVVILGGMLLALYVSVFKAAPVPTVVFSAMALFAGWKIYPKILDSM